MTTKTLLTILAVLVIITALAFVSAIFIPTTRTLSEREAVDTVLLKYPELAQYQTTSLPPSSIDAKQTKLGWVLGFIRRGSGLPGIIDARCYSVDNNKNITAVGEFKKESTTTIVDSINLETCAPLEVTSSQASSSVSTSGLSVSIPGVTPSSPIAGPVMPPVKKGIYLGDVVSFGFVSIRPISIEEDSRCPVDVVCIQAGTIRLKIQVTTSTSSSINIIKLGQEFITQGSKITLTNVFPDKRSTVNILDKDYNFNFHVVRQTTPILPPTAGACYVGGCSSQICSDRTDAISTCEYSPRYACYKTATCSRQSTGQCGWTSTPSLNACLINN